MQTNNARIDYLTLTTYDIATGNYWLNYVMSTCYASSAIQQKIQQYKGFRIHLDEGGSLFVGEGEQDNKPHFMLQATGEGSENIFAWASFDLTRSRVNCSRIDIQVTIEQPDNWSQLELFTACELAGYKPEIRRSGARVGDGELITVYTGTRAGGRLNRTYQKESETGERFLRFETEFGRGYAMQVAHSLATGNATRQGYIDGEVWRKRKVSDYCVFSSGCFMALPVMEVRESDKTEEWLLNVVLPSFTRYVNSHDADPFIRDSFAGVCQRAGGEWVA